MNKVDLWRKVLFFLLCALCFTPYFSAPLALLCGMIFAQFRGNLYRSALPKVTKFLLQASVVGLGLGMNVHSALKAGSKGFVFTIVSIVTTMTLGLLLGRLLKISHKTAYLISGGTAICGGSAIAALSPIIRAKENQVSVALGTVFALNSVALFLFPFLGHMLHLTQDQFGLWAAIAIHDTSSVVGAGSHYGPRALEVATTVKLARALWIIPLSFLSSFWFRNRKGKISIPYFIVYFIIAMLINTYVPGVSHYGGTFVVYLAKLGLTLSLFLIGSGLSLDVFKKVGFKSFLLGICIWVFISVSALLAVYFVA